MLKNLFDYTKELFFPGKKQEPSHYIRTPKIIDRDQHGIDRRQVSVEALRTIRNLQREGYKAYVVGGAVRDLLLGVRPKDFDVVTDATPEQIKRCQRRAIIIGKRFRLVHVLFGKEIIECSTFRALEGAGVRKDRFGRVVSDNVFGEMWEDAARRDFTINALYYDPTTEQVIDYHNGMQDILQGVVRMIGEPAKRYREDPVRMLRAVRIASKLKFDIEPKTLEPISQLCSLLANVPQARLFDEAIKLLTCGQAVACMEKLRSLNLYRHVIPLLEVALNEANGEKFLALAMKRTDERIAIGKKVSPSFLFATLLWPLTERIFNERIARGEGQVPAMAAAGRQVLQQQCSRLQIQARFVDDILTIWILQIKLLRRGSKSAMGLLHVPKFRAGYDFMLLRSQLDFVDTSIVDWWTKFQEVGDDERMEMIRQQADENAKNRKARKGEPKKPSKAQVKRKLMQEADDWKQMRDVSAVIDDWVDDVEDVEPQESLQESEPVVLKRRTTKKDSQRSALTQKPRKSCLLTQENALEEVLVVESLQTVDVKESTSTANFADAESLQEDTIALIDDIEAFPPKPSRCRRLPRKVQSAKETL